MNVRLIAITQPAIDECQGPDDLIAYCARVSNPGNQANAQTAPRLLSYLVRHEHWSPFEMASMTLEIRTTRDIARQILRHRSFSFQEFSQRYAAVGAAATAREARLQDTTNRQNSLDAEDPALKAWWQRAQEVVAKHSELVYSEALRRGIAKEVARAVLAEGMTESVLYMAGTIRSWIHYCQLRAQPGTQKEHRDIAIACADILLRQFPSLAEVIGLPVTDASAIGAGLSHKGA